MCSPDRRRAASESTRDAALLVMRVLVPPVALCMPALDRDWHAAVLAKHWEELSESMRDKGKPGEPGPPWRMESNAGQQQWYKVITLTLDGGPTGHSARR